MRENDIPARGKDGPQGLASGACRVLMQGTNALGQLKVTLRQLKRPAGSLRWPSMAVLNPLSPGRSNFTIRQRAVLNP